MRRLSFGTEQVDKDRFDILYSGICVSPRGVQRTELATVNSLMGKLEGVGKKIAKAKSDSPVQFELSDEGGVVLLEEPEFEMVNEFHGMVRWSTIVAKKAEETYNWLDHIPQEKLEIVK